MRHPALIPLSREHHYALVFCRTVRRLPDDLVPLWIEKARTFFALDLRPHFDTEEEVLFPACRQLGLDGLVDELVHDHRALQHAVQTLSTGEDLRALSDMLEAHVRREERELFPLLDSRLDASLQRDVEARLGRAETPRDPSLLQERRLDQRYSG